MKRTLLVLGLACALTSAAVPCLWDYDTLAQERARFPTALELIAGKFPRHSEAYWRWRVEDRRARLDAGESAPELYDDLAVAHEKLGDHERAIALMHEKEQLFPGLYETAANHGTFLIHAGRFEEGADEIARAIAIDPDAHFGREVYQELLVRYVLKVRANDGPPLPLHPEPLMEFHREPEGFWDFVRAARPVEDERVPTEIRAATKGVLGMMRFGNHDSPVLLEALSDVLLAEYDHDGKRLAARALLKASYRVEDEGARAAYRAKAEAALATQTPTPRHHRGMKLEELEPRFLAELEDAERWYAGLVADEGAWIAGGEDVDARFQAKYLVPVDLAPSKNEPLGGGEPLRFVYLALGLGLVFAAVWMLTRKDRRPRAAS